MHVFHVEACGVEHIGHLAVALIALLTNDGRLHAAFCTTFKVDAKRFCRAVEVLEIKLVGVVLVVVETLKSQSVAGLVAVEQIRSAEPGVAQLLNVKRIIICRCLDVQLASGAKRTDGDEFDSGFVQSLCGLAVVGNLKNQCRIFGKQQFHRVAFAERLKVDFQTSLVVREGHFEQCGNQTTSRNVVSGNHQTAVNQILNGIECLYKIFCISNVGAISTHTVDYLCESRTAKFESVFRQIDVEQLRLHVVQHRRHSLADVGGLANGRHNHSSGRQNLVAVRIFLRHRERVFSCRNVDSKFDAELAQSLDSLVKTGVFTRIEARPHPVGAQRDAFNLILNRCPNNVCKCFCHSHS